MITEFRDGLRAAVGAIVTIAVLSSVSIDGRAEVGLPSFDGVGVLEPPKVVANFQLIDQDGSEFSFQQLRGKVVLVFFGFTNCPDVCPTMMDKFRMLLGSGQVDVDDVSIVLISVDGERDSPEVMKKFVRRFSQHFIGLTGPENEVKLIAKEFAASFFKGNTDKGGRTYSVMHSPQAFVIDRNGLLVAEMFSPSIDAMAGLVNALAQTE